MIRRLVVVGAIVTGVVALVAGPAFAHVEIERTGDVTNAGTLNASLHVPNEEDGAGTVKVTLVFPATPVLKTAEPQLVDGWTFNVEKDPVGDVTQIVWTGGPLTGSKVVTFPMTLGAIPAGTSTIGFKALQTYDNNDVVRWIEATPANGDEPEHPAPVLYVKGNPPPEGDSAATTTKDTSKTTSSSDGGMSTGVIVAIVLGAVVVLALLAWVLSRSRRDMGSRTD